MKPNRPQSMPSEVQAQVEDKPADERRRIEQVWDLLGQAEPSLSGIPDTEAALADVNRRIDPLAPEVRKRAPVRPPIRRTRPRVGVIAWAGVVVFLILGLVWWQQPTVMGTGPGEQVGVTLPDGSTVYLNSDTRLSFARNFQSWPLISDGQRKVKLEGEGYFEIVTDGRPFIIETFNARVEVLGTTFNVRARQGSMEAETRVTLASGKVRVVAIDQPDAPILLTEVGQEARISASPLSPEPETIPTTDIEQVMAWREQGFTANDQPLAAILAEVERRYALSVLVEDGIALSDSMTIFYSREATAEKILHDVCLAQQCQYRKTSNGFVLYPVNTSPID